MRSNLLRSCLFSATDAASRFDLATSRPFWVRGAGWGWPRFKFVAAGTQYVELKFMWQFFVFPNKSVSVFKPHVALVVMYEIIVLFSNFMNHNKNNKWVISRHLKMPLNLLIVRFLNSL